MPPRPPVHGLARTHLHALDATFSVTLTLDNKLSDTMVRNRAWDLAPGGTYLAAGLAAAPPLAVASMAHPVSNNGGIFASEVGASAVGGLVAYRLPDAWLLVVYFTIRGVNVGVSPPGTPVGAALYAAGAGWDKEYKGVMMAAGGVWTLRVRPALFCGKALGAGAECRFCALLDATGMMQVHSEVQMSADTYTLLGLIRCNCVKPGLAILG